VRSEFIYILPGQDAKKYSGIGYPPSPPFESGGKNLRRQEKSILFMIVALPAVIIVGTLSLVMR
jgi:hypothetical protein